MIKHKAYVSVNYLVYSSSFLGGRMSSDVLATANLQLLEGAGYLQDK